jgi:hypothetical protein
MTLHKSDEKHALPVFKEPATSITMKNEEPGREKGEINLILSCD